MVPLVSDTEPLTYGAHMSGQEKEKEKRERFKGLKG
jgi:hypothetical protein